METDIPENKPVNQYSNFLAVPTLKLYTRPIRGSPVSTVWVGRAFACFFFH